MAEVCFKTFFRFFIDKPFYFIARHELNAGQRIVSICFRRKLSRWQSIAKTFPLSKQTLARAPEKVDTATQRT
jgi:hypothetical protein